MKICRRILIGLLSICLLLSLFPAVSIAQTPQKISLQYSFSTATVTSLDGINTVYIPGLNNAAFAEAELPVKSLQILLPYGMTVDQCGVTYSKETVVTNVDLPEPPLYYAISDMSVTATASTTPASSHYSAGSVQYMRGFAFYVIDLYPVTYQNRTLRSADEIALNITLKATDAAEYDEADYIPTIVDTDFLPEEYECPENLSSYFRVTPTITDDDRTLAGAGIIDYIIITKENFVSAFSPLITFKRSKGLTAKIVTVESIYKRYKGRDKAEKIRKFIKAAYKTNRVKFILLGGDADANSSSPTNITYYSIVPTRLLYVSGVSPYYVASDLYYSCMGGNYDYDLDKKFGETTDGVNGKDVDLLPDVYVGRAPVSTITQVKSFVSKTIAYEKRTKSKSALMVGEYMGNYQYWYGYAKLYGKDWKEEIRKGSTLKFTSKRIPTTYTVRTLYDKDRTTSWTSSNLVKLLNKNYELVNHMGHANNTYVMRLTPSTLSSLKNTKSFFIFSHGCYAGAFDNMKPSGTYGAYTSSDAMSERFITMSNRAGTVANIMNSRYGWFSWYTETGLPYTLSGTQLFDRSFFDKFVRARRTSVGVLLAKSKAKIYNIGQVTTNSTNRYCYYELNLMGDPEMSLTTKIATLGLNYTTKDERDYVIDLTTVDATSYPQTGDSFPLSTLLIVLAVSLCGLTLTLVYSKLRKRHAYK